MLYVVNGVFKFHSTVTGDMKWRSEMRDAGERCGGGGHSNTLRGSMCFHKPCWEWRKDNLSTLFRGQKPKCHSRTGLPHASQVSTALILLTNQTTVEYHIYWTSSFPVLLQTLQSRPSMVNIEKSSSKNPAKRWLHEGQSLNLMFFSMSFVLEDLVFNIMVMIWGGYWNCVFGQTLVELDRKLHGQASMSVLKRRPVGQRCPICDKLAGLSLVAVHQHMRRAHPGVSSPLSTPPHV